jgi:hypothetical protein
MQEVFIDFDIEDNPVVSVKGAPGRTCKDLTRDLEMKLGKVQVEVKTQEYWQSEVKNVNIAYNRRG